MIWLTIILQHTSFWWFDAFIHSVPSALKAYPSPQTLLSWPLWNYSRQCLCSTKSPQICFYPSCASQLPLSTASCCRSLKKLALELLEPVLLTGCWEFVSPGATFNQWLMRECVSPSSLPQVGASLRYNLHCSVSARTVWSPSSVELWPELHVYLPSSKSASSWRPQNTPLVSVQFIALQTN